MVNDNRILATRIYSTFAFWSAIGPEAIITFLHIGSHHSVTSQAAVTYLFTMFNHVTYSPHAFHIIAVFWPSNKPASSYKKRKKKTSMNSSQYYAMSVTSQQGRLVCYSIYFCCCCCCLFLARARGEEFFVLPLHILGYTSVVLAYMFKKEENK